MVRASTHSSANGYLRRPNPFASVALACARYHDLNGARSERGVGRQGRPVEPSRTMRSQVGSGACRHPNTRSMVDGREAKCSRTLLDGFRTAPGVDPNIADRIPNDRHCDSNRRASRCHALPFRSAPATSAVRPWRQHIRTAFYGMRTTETAVSADERPECERRPLAPRTLCVRSRTVAALIPNGTRRIPNTLTLHLQWNRQWTPIKAAVS